MMAIYIQINIDRWCYMYHDSKVHFNFLYIPATEMFQANKLFYINYNKQVHIGTGLRLMLFDLV